MLVGGGHCGDFGGLGFLGGGGEGGHWRRGEGGRRRRGGWGMTEEGLEGGPYTWHYRTMAL